LQYFGKNRMRDAHDPLCRIGAEECPVDRDEKWIVIPPEMDGPIHEVDFFENEDDDENDIPTVDKPDTPVPVMTIACDPDDAQAHECIDDDENPPLRDPGPENTIDA
jgi:hypothetical protein